MMITGRHPPSIDAMTAVQPIAMAMPVSCRRVASPVTRTRRASSTRLTLSIASSATSLRAVDATIQARIPMVIPTCAASEGSDPRWSIPMISPSTTMIVKPGRLRACSIRVPLSARVTCSNLPC